MTSGNRPAPEQGSWHVPGAASAYEPAAEPARGDARGRPGIVALVVALTELVVIAAAGNQEVYKHAFRYFDDHRATFLGNAVGSSLTFAWRVTPRDGETRDWVSQLVVIGVFVVLSALLAGLAARGTLTFWRAFFGIWTAVIAAACVAHVAGGFVTKSEPGVDRATRAVFGSITGLSIFAAVVVGLLAALIAGLFALATRRAVERPAVAAAPAEPAYVPETPPPFYGAARHPQPGTAPQAGAPPVAAPPAGSQPAAPQEADGRTTQIPRFDPRGGQHWTPPADGGDTTAFPRADDGGSTQAMPTAPDDDRR